MKCQKTNAAGNRIFPKRRNYFRLPILLVFLTFTGNQLFAQYKVFGKVTAGGTPLTGVTVKEKSRANTTQTDNNGSYSITVAANAELVFSHIGFANTIIAVNSQKQINVVLNPVNQVLNDVVVIGYGTQKRSDLTGSLSSLSAKDFKDQPVTRIDQALQGRVSGVQVNNSSGAPGGDVKIRIRGANSILGDNNPLYVIDGFIGAEFNNINPDDIASIEVLKDASSTAIYGSRGANGVVLITTKKGNSSKPEITVSGNYYNSSVIKKHDLMNAYDYANSVNMNNLATGVNPAFTQAQLNGYKANGGTNWQDLIYRRAPGQEYKIGVSGGGEKTNYFISGDYFNQDGILLNSNYKRYAIRSNIHSRVNDKLSLRLNFSAVRRENLNTSQQGKSSPMGQALAWAPTTPVRDTAGNYTIKDPTGSIFNNPVALATDQINIANNTTGNIIGGANYYFTKDLSFDVSFGVDYQNQQGKYFYAPSITGNNPSAGRTSNEYLNLQNTNTLNYLHTFNKVNRLNITAAFEQQKYTNNGFSAGASGLTFPNLRYDNLSLASTISAGAFYSASSIVSFLGRVNYSYLDKYLITASVRRDGSSKFQGNNQYSTFPSLALAWKLSEESFIKKINFFNSLKLRSSWGITGSQAISPYATMATYKSDLFNSFTNSSLSSGIALGNAANPNLKWETTTALDFGLDMSILNNRLNFSIDYYQKKTKDLLLSLALPAYAGGGSIISNVGSMQNNGVDLNISGTPIAAGKFVWTSSFNISFFNNKVTNTGTSPQIFAGNYGSGLSTQPEFVVQSGYALGSYWGLKYLGTWKPSEAAQATLYGNKAGDSKYQDLNGDHAINSSDYQIIGNGLPKRSLGWDNNFKLGNFNLNIFVQSLMGYDKLDYAFGVSMTGSADSRQATNNGILNRYIPGSNETSDIPAFSTTNKNVYQSTRFLEKGDFVRIKNINLSYNLPKNTIKNIDIKLFIGATNLFTITKYKGMDPESTNTGSGSDITQSIDYGSYPNSKTFTTGVSFKF